MAVNNTAEYQRLEDTRLRRAQWKLWGPYLSERQWGTVREDYSDGGAAWDYFPHDHARSRAYRWGEDGIAGISDEEQRLCFAVALWNGRDPILKERLFGLTGPQGNHGEDVKEYYFYLDSTPTHSYMSMLYKYPQAEFPYADLLETNQRRGREQAEYELVHTGVFDEQRYFDVLVEYAKDGPADLLIRISATNRGPDPAALHMLPTLWFRNTWSWGSDHTAERAARPRLWAHGANIVSAEHPELGHYTLDCNGEPTLLFTDNESNLQRLFGAPNATPFVKDGVHEAVVNGNVAAVNPERTGTKAAAHYRATLQPGETSVFRLRLAQDPSTTSPRRDGWAPPASEGKIASFDDFDAIFATRLQEADEFYREVQPVALSADERLVQRQSLAGMLWSKQYYYYEVDGWLRGDPAQPQPPASRSNGRNQEWRHFSSGEILSMPDKWEYPWFAAWDLAFHCLPLALVDTEFAKEQILHLGREWFQHPNGQIPAYEWAFGDVNPPVLAWAAWRVYKIDQKQRGAGDTEFLERAFHKLMLNFTWWVNRKDSEGKNVFQGGFLGLDNIGVFDRSAPLPTGGHIEQSDGTSWMGMFCLNMLTISLELARRKRAYEDVATKFFQHFLYIADAMNNIGGEGIALWNEEDEFFYDVLHLPAGGDLPMKIRSIVGLIPLFAVTTIEPALLAELPEFRARMEWFLEHRPRLASLVSRWQEPGMGERRLLAIVRGHRMKRLLRRMLDETEFLSDYGVRALSRHHAEHPYHFDIDGRRYSVEYQPAESNSGLFGGNSNWRGPIWFPVNYLLFESLQQFHHYYGDDFSVECPTGSGNLLSLSQIADEIGGRLTRIFLRDGDGRRPVFGDESAFQNDPHWRDLIPFYEYFDGDNGRGVGASHQTGWTGLVAKLLDSIGRHRPVVAPAMVDASPPRSPR
ncbi:MAG: glucosidase [Chloroflexota bacterium]